MNIFHLPPALRRACWASNQWQNLQRLQHAALSTRAQAQPAAPHARGKAAEPAAEDFLADEEPAQLLSLEPATLNSYKTAVPPTNAQLKQAVGFFTRGPPHLLYSAGKFHECPPSPFPEVAFLGRSNVGKSSLLNALFGRTTIKPAHVSSRPGRTRSMNGFGIGGQGMIGKGKTKKLQKGLDGEVKKENLNEVAWKRFGRGGLVIVDMPGYGGGSREEWGAAAMRFLQQRTQLRRTFLLLDAEHGLKRTDLELVRFLHGEGLPFQIVLSKVDKLLYPKTSAPGPEGLHNRLLALRDVQDGIRATLNEAFKLLQEGGSARRSRDVMLDVLCCSSEKSLQGNRKIGVDELRWAVMTACNIDGLS